MNELMEKYLSHASKVYECTDMKVSALMSAAERQLAINHNEALLKVMTESGTDDDLNYLYEEADKSFVETANRAIQKIKDNIIQFFSELRDKIIVMMTERDVKRTLEQLQKKLRLMPLVSRVKITVENFAEQVKVCNASVTRLTKLAVKKISGQKVTSEDVSDVESYFTSAHEKAIGVKMAVTTTVGNAVDMLNERMKSMTADIKKVEEDTKADLNKYSQQMKNCESAEDASIWTKICAVRSRIGQKLGEDYLRFFKDTLSKIKSTVSRNKQDSEDSSVAEGADDGLENPMIPGTDPTETDPIDAMGGDSWDTVLNGLDDMIPGGEGCNEGNCGEGCGEGCKTESTDTFDDLFQEFFGGDCTKGSECKSQLWDGYPATKPSNESIVSDLFKDVMAEVKGQNPEPKPTTESTFDSLMKEIDELF